VPPGTILKQTPAAGTKAGKGQVVSVLVAVRADTVSVPDIVGLTAIEADRALRAKQLTLGQASPGPLEPARKIASQIPAAREVVKIGTPVRIFYVQPHARPTPTASPSATASVPALTGLPVTAAEKKARLAGLTVRKLPVIDPAPAGTVIATIPADGKPAPGGRLILRVSAGYPQIAFSHAGDIVISRDGSATKHTRLATAPPAYRDPTWNADGTELAYVGDGQVFLKDMHRPDQPPTEQTTAGQQFADLAWSPRGDVLAMDGPNSTQPSLCLMAITSRPVPQCKSEPAFAVGRAIHWAPDGRSILAVATESLNSGLTGIVRWTTQTPFSANPDDWSDGQFVTEIAGVDKGVLDAAISPDGRHLALVSDLRSSGYQLWLTTPGDFRLRVAQPTGVRACKVAWRSDSRELAVLQSNELCTEDVEGTLVRLPLAHPTSLTEFAAKGDDPSFQPLRTGG
jgi:dipeptidyl aminopeptidase/acylaminoacyl peptidase